MSRIAGRFAQLQKAGRTALVPYLTAGDPEPAATVPLLHTLVQAGADLIELGVPFSDPMADGPVIQAACERALAHQVSLRDVLDMAAEFRNDDAETPLVLMGYANPIVAMGIGTFAEQAAQAGVDGVLVVDLPPEEADAIRQALIDHELDEIFLLAPTTTETRIRQICGQAKRVSLLCVVARDDRRGPPGYGGRSGTYEVHPDTRHPARRHRVRH